MFKRDTIATAASIISICVTLLLFTVSCSKEEELGFPAKVVKVRKPIISPSQVSSVDSKTPEEAKPDTEQKRIESAKPLITEKKGSKESKKEGGGEQTGIGKEFGTYLVKKGDSLSRISGMKEVYGDPLKWPILLRFNLDRLGTLKMDENLPEQDLPDGMKLQFLFSEAALKRAKEVGQSTWVVNVHSAPISKDLNLTAIRLVREGYHAYITKAEIKGKEWLRLRVGFFKTKADAEREGKKINKILQLEDSWYARAELSELQDYAGY
ncbi:MAG: SPOR domain-containing protein [Pseudomonadota bacterium]